MVRHTPSVQLPGTKRKTIVHPINFTPTADHHAPEVSVQKPPSPARPPHFPTPQTGRQSVFPPHHSHSQTIIRPGTSAIIPSGPSSAHNTEIVEIVHARQWNSGDSDTGMNPRDSYSQQPHDHSKGHNKGHNNFVTRVVSVPELRLPAELLSKYGGGGYLPPTRSRSVTTTLKPEIDGGKQHVRVGKGLKIIPQRDFVVANYLTVVTNNAGKNVRSPNNDPGTTQAIRVDSGVEIVENIPTYQEIIPSYQPPLPPPPPRHSYCPPAGSSNQYHGNQQQQNCASTQIGVIPRVLPPLPPRVPCPFAAQGAGGGCNFYGPSTSYAPQQGYPFPQPFLPPPPPPPSCQEQQYAPPPPRKVSIATDPHLQYGTENVRKTLIDTGTGGSTTNFDHRKSILMQHPPGRMDYANYSSPRKSDPHHSSDVPPPPQSFQDIHPHFVVNTLEQQPLHTHTHLGGHVDLDVVALGGGSNQHPEYIHTPPPESPWAVRSHSSLFHHPPQPPGPGHPFPSSLGGEDVNHGLVPIYRTVTQTKLQIIEHPDQSKDVKVIKTPVEEFVGYERMS